MTILTGDKAKVQVMGIHDMEGKEQWPALVGSKTPILHTETPIQTPRAKIPVVKSSKKPKWVNLFQGNRLAAQGITLQYVAHVVHNGETVVELSKIEVELETQRWKHALILYVVGANPTIAALERYIATNWNYITKPKVYYHNDGYFFVKFTMLDDRDEVLYAGPHMLNNKPIIMKTWSPKFDFNKEVMQTIPIWVKFPNLSLNCWGVNSLSRIGSGLRVPIYADECTTQVDRISYAIVLIEMEITKTLPIELKVEDPNGRLFTQEISYEWVPTY
ncbi:hypothetical protein KY285_013639 [Solanum tuberosum]|nr:hypothetical protein KY285_013639 [Solanum tuberosum]